MLSIICKKTEKINNLTKAYNILNHILDILAVKSNIKHIGIK